MTVPPGGLGDVAWSASPGEVVARIAGSTLRTVDHAISILLVDAATGRAVSLDYGASTAVESDAFGHLATVRLSTGSSVPPSLRAYLMVDTYPASVAAL
ncbi:MAG: hypothetical protein U0166_16840 [Acidobacteriota bacterium]